MKYEIKNINWYDCIFWNISSSNTITIQVYYRAWSIYENKKNNWISHFIEHMMFKWSKKYKNSKIVSEKIDEIWWISNAYTSEEYVCYYIKTANEFYDKAIDILFDLVNNPNFDLEDINKEKWVIVQEIMMYEDMPTYLVMDLWKRYYYWDNSYWRNILWSVDNVNSFNKKDIKWYMNNNYNQKNWLIVVCWKLNQENKKSIYNKIEESFKNQSKKNVQTNTPKNFALNLPKDKLVKVEKNLSQNHLVLWSPWFRYDDEKKYIWYLIWIMLWWTLSSRLYQKIREELWLCYYFSTAHYANSFDWTLILRTWMDKEKFDTWLEKIYEMLDEVAENWFTEDELSKAKWYIKWKTKMWIEGSDSYADFLWDQYITDKSITTLEKLTEKYEKIKLSDVNEICKIYWHNNFYWLYII